MSDALWTIEDLSAYLKIPKATIYQWRYKGTGPPGVSLGRHVRFLPEEVVAWLKDQGTEGRRSGGSE